MAQIPANLKDRSTEKKPQLCVPHALTRKTLENLISNPHMENFTTSGEEFEPCLKGSKTGFLKILTHCQRCAAKLVA